MKNYSVTTSPVSSADPLRGLVPLAVNKAAHDSHPREIQVAFSQGGVLIRSVQKTNAHLELHHCDVTVEQAKQRHAQGDSAHGGLRKWTLAHADLCPNYYMMNANSPISRHIAFIALPEKVGEHIVGIHQNDADSGNPADHPVMRGPDARIGLNALLGVLKDNQRERPGVALINNEVQTVGVAPQGIAGMLFQPNMKVTTWAAAKIDFQKVINAGGPEFEGRTFPIFSYVTDDQTHKTELRHLDSLSVGGRESGPA